ncbi:MAG: type III pantothenate kinase [Clostridia bacterium]|nr:type III pantothenate kinase [Clostridia bacterium]
MLLAVDIGNSSITVGGFCEAEEPLFTVRFSAGEHRSADEYAAMLRQTLEQKGIGLETVTDCAVVSVVPMLTYLLEQALQQLCSCRVLTVGAGVKTGFSICTDAPAEVGADIIANTAAAVKAGVPAVIVDMGTATTVFAVNGKKELIGGVILPGIRSSVEGLRSATAQLPVVAPETPKKAVGKNTADCISIGVLQGHAFAIDGFIEAFKREAGMENAAVVATGGLCRLILPLCKEAIKAEPYLTLKGLRVIYENTRKKRC